MEKKIDLDEIIQSELNLYMINWINKCEYRRRLIKGAMEEVIRQALELAAENAEVIELNSSGYGYEINKKSILDTIKQVKI